MIDRYAQRFRTLAAMGIVVGFGGCLMTAFFGVMAVTGVGVFQDRARFSIDSEFAPGQEVPTDTVSASGLTGGILVLAHPETIDPSTVQCTTKSRVYSTGERNVDEVVIQAPEGVADVMASVEPARRRFVPLAIVDWMGTELISCTGEGVESFALTSSKGITTDGFRYGVGAVLLLFSLVLLGVGFLALHLTRTWSRRAAQTAYRQPPDHRPLHPPLPPGHNPYDPPPGSPR